MKKIYIIAALGLSMGFCSCSDYLESDRYFKDRITYNKVFKDKEYSDQWLSDTYSHLNGENRDVSTKEDTPQNFSDDMYFTDQGASAGELYKRYRNVEYDESWQQGTLSSSYRGISKACTFIKYIDMNEELSPEEILDYKAQARFVRAYFYWLLLRKYGPIPLLPDEGEDYTESYDELSIPRNTYDECVEYITNELALAAKDLPLKRELLSIARPTRGSALAARAKVLLYAASPLMNGNQDDYANKMVDDQGKRLLAAEYDESKWAKAAAAAKDVMELKQYELYVARRRTSGNTEYPATIEPYDDGNFSRKNWPEGYADIDPFESYRSVFNGELNAYANPELIFTRGQNSDIYNMVKHQLPSFANGWNCHGVSQKQCDAYYMSDGKDCPGKDRELGRGDGSERRRGLVTEDDEKAGRYKPLLKGVSLQYAEREPRFYASVGYNGCLWNLSSATKPERHEHITWYYRGKQDGRNNTLNWMMTGIGIKKYVKPSDTEDDGGKISGKIEPAIRYAEILLIYAEALNELDGSYSVPSWDGKATYTITRDVNELKKGIQPIRIRAGIPDYTNNVYNNKDEFRKKLKRERQIELMGENHRYYDLRRWKDAQVEETTPIYGCNTLMTDKDPELFHTPVVIPFLPTTFSDKAYFLPFNFTELKRNKRLTQNPGWNYYD